MGKTMQNRQNANAKVNKDFFTDLFVFILNRFYYNIAQNERKDKNE